MLFVYGQLADNQAQLQPFLIEKGIYVRGQEVLFDIPNIGLFYFVDEQKLIVQLATDCNINQAAPYIYSNILTVFLQKRNLFTIHASGIVVDNALVLFSGISGIGKSTLVGQLFQKGYPLFCDDRCVFYWKESSQSFYAKPSMPTIRLMKDAIEQLPNTDWLKNGRDASYKVDKIEFDIKKNIVKKEQKIQHLYIIRNIQKDGVLFINPIQGNQKMTLLKQQSFKHQFINHLGRQKEHFLFLTKVIQSLPISVIQRPVGTSIHTFSAFVEENILLPISSNT